MTGPDGRKSAGYWDVLEVQAPRRFVVDDGFADDTGEPNPDLPTTRTRVDITAVEGGTRMLITTTFPSPEAMEQLVAMGMEEGMSQALAQTDAILAELGATA